MRCALAQMMSGPDPAANLEAMSQTCTRAAAAGARLVAFPEMAMALPQGRRTPAHFAQGLHDDFVSALEAMARRADIFLAAGIWERLPDPDRAANTLVVIAPDRGCIASYRKLHLFDALSVCESDTLRAGSTVPPIVAVGDVPVGLAICYDLRFPELFRDLALRGAEAILVAAAWYAGPLKEDHWLTLLRARAIENTCYLLGVNQIGPKFCGRSAVFDPFGVIKAEAGEGPELLITDLGRERVREVRRRLPTLHHCRTDLYGSPRRAASAAPADAD